jgi:hypothetical protein
MFGMFHGQALSPSRCVLAPEFFCARSQDDRAPAKYDHLKRETGSDKRKSGVGLLFFRPLSFARSKLQELIEGSGTPANAGSQPPHLAMRRAPFWSAHA